MSSRPQFTGQKSFSSNQEQGGQKAKTWQTGTKKGEEEQEVSHKHPREQESLEEVFSQQQTGLDRDNETQQNRKASQDQGKETLENNSSKADLVEDQEDQEDLIANLKEKVADLEQRLQEDAIRALANIQNLQRRHKNELEDAHRYANEKFAKNMLAIRDYLEKALSDESGNAQAVRKGVELTLKQLNTAFDAAHIIEIDPQGEQFDPHRHEAIQGIVSEDQAPNTVLQVYQKGYALHGRVLRPARVVVAKAK